MQLKEIALKLGAELKGDGSLEIRKVANLLTAGPDEISFLSDPRYRASLSKSQAGCVIVRKDDAAHLKDGTSALIMQDPYLGFARCAQLLDSTPAVAAGIAADAVVEEGAKLGKNVSLGHWCLYLHRSRSYRRYRDRKQCHYRQFVSGGA